MHRAALKALGLPHTYEAVDVGDLDHLHSMVDALRQGIFARDERHRALQARGHGHGRPGRSQRDAVGAANTLVRSRNRVIAYNTDAAGLADELRATRRPVALLPSSVGRGGARGGCGMHGLRRQCHRGDVALLGRERVARRLEHRRRISRHGGPAVRLATSPVRVMARARGSARPCGFSGATSRRARRSSSKRPRQV